MTTKTAAALRALETDLRAYGKQVGGPNTFAHWADRIAAVLTQEGADTFQPIINTERVAQIAAHRACCGTEHDPTNGKLHGCCVVCGVPWPCEYAGKPPPAPAEPRAAEGAGKCDWCGISDSGICKNPDCPTRTAAVAVPAGGDAVVPGPRIEYRDPEWVSIDSFPLAGPVLIAHEKDDGDRWVEAWEAKCWHRDRANIRPDTPKHLIHAKGIAWMWAPKLPGETMLSTPPAAQAQDAERSMAHWEYARALAAKEK